jgi:DNA adenine methylase
MRYVEPFAGSACLFFAIRPVSAIISDINSDLIGTLRAVRDQPQAVYNRISCLPLGKDAYYRIRQEHSSQLSSIDQAARFIYLNRFCFNGLYRTNLSGRFNVPYAPTKTGQLPTLDELYTSAKTLSCAQIDARDFEETLCDVRSGDFIYMDPPYAVRNRRIFRQYGPDSFGTKDLARLASALSHISRCGATFLVSYAMCQEALDAFDGWHIRRVQTQRSIAGFSRHRSEADELLVSNRELSDDD